VDPAPRKLRLSPFVSVIPAPSGVFVRSDLRSFTLSGGSVDDFLRRALPLLDGTRDAEQIGSAFPDYSRESVVALLDQLERHGIVQSEAGIQAPRLDELRAFLASWNRGARDLASAVESARVAVIGSTDWATSAHVQLLEAGMTPEHLVLPEEDEPSFAALHDVSLLIVAAHPDDLRLLDRVARIADKAGVRYLVAQVEGLKAILGPVVVPGETACWECLRRRQLANRFDFEESAQLHAALLSGVAPRRRPLGPPGASTLVASLIVIECVKLLSGYTPSQLVGRQLEIDLVTLAARTHDVIRLPWCDVCGGAAALGATGDLEAVDSRQDLASSGDPADLRARLSGWVDERQGPVRQLVLNDPPPESPQSLSIATAVVAGPAIPSRHHGHAEPLVGSGKGTTKVAAMLGAVGEAIERYSASIYREGDLVRASARRLGDRALDPASLCLYRPDQYARPGFPYDPFDPDREISWIPGRWLDTGETVLVPALVAYFNYAARRGERFCQVTSNGLAAGATLEDAELRATLELLERDAFMMTWLQRRTPRLLEVREEIGSDVLAVLSELHDLGVGVECYLLPGDTAIPVVMCIGWGDGKARPAATVALAASYRAVEATRKAVLEQAHVNPYITRLMHDSSQTVPKRATAVRSLNDHALYYVPCARIKAFDFIRSAGRPAAALSALEDRPRSATEVIKEGLARAGHRVAVVDVTSPDVRRGPFRVARAVGTFLQPIDFGHQLRRLANPRLGARINPDPHPLA
jgi:ribosomal protein S12 methylthiotransferase accessory factor